MTKINQTTIDPEVPLGGTIREIIGWEATVPEASHTFYLLSFYGAGTTMESILANIVASSYITVVVSAPGQSRQDILDTLISEGAPLGTFSCATIIAEGFDGSAISGIYDSKVDINVLTIIPALGASIISTSFSRI